MRYPVILAGSLLAGTVCPAGRGTDRRRRSPMSSRCRRRRCRTCRTGCVRPASTAADRRHLGRATARRRWSAIQQAHQLQVTGQLNQATAATLGLDPGLAADCSRGRSRRRRRRISSARPRCRRSRRGCARSASTTARWMASGAGHPGRRSNASSRAAACSRTGSSIRRRSPRWAWRRTCWRIAEDFAPAAIARAWRPGGISAGPKLDGRGGTPCNQPNPHSHHAYRQPAATGGAGRSLSAEEPRRSRWMRSSPRPGAPRWTTSCANSTKPASMSATTASSSARRSSSMCAPA